jgi:hypothetical protein
MIECQLSLLAKAAIRDVETNAISIFHIIEEINAVSFPVFFHDLAFFAYLVKDNTDPSVTEIVFEISMDGDASPIIGMRLNIDFEGKRGNRIIVKIAGLPIPRPGVLKAELHTADKSKRIGSYDVIVLKPESVPQVDIKASAR